MDVKWNGCNVYENYSASGIMIDMRVSFNSLVALTCEQLELDESVELSVLLDFGKTNVQIVVPIMKDNDVAWYLAFAKDATSRHPLVARVSVNCLGMSSSFSSIRKNVDISLNINSSSSVSNDEVIRDISYYYDLKEECLFESKEVLSKYFCIITVKTNF